MPFFLKIINFIRAIRVFGELSIDFGDTLRARARRRDKNGLGGRDGGVQTTILCDLLCVARNYCVTRTCLERQDNTSRLTHTHSRLRGTHSIVYRLQTLRVTHVNDWEFCASRQRLRQGQGYHTIPMLSHNNHLA